MVLNNLGTPLRNVSYKLGVNCNGMKLNNLGNPKRNVSYKLEFCVMEWCEQLRKFKRNVSYKLGVICNGMVLNNLGNPKKNMSYKLGQRKYATFTFFNLSKVQTGNCTITVP